MESIFVFTQKGALFGPGSMFVLSSGLYLLGFIVSFWIPVSSGRVLVVLGFNIKKSATNLVCVSFRIFQYEVTSKGKWVLFEAVPDAVE